MIRLHIFKDGRLHGVGALWPEDQVVTVRWIVESEALAAEPTVVQQIRAVPQRVAEVVEEDVVVETIDAQGRAHRRPAVRHRVRHRWEPKYIRKNVRSRHVQPVVDRSLATTVSVFESPQALAARGYTVVPQTAPPRAAGGFFSRLFGG